MSPRHVLLTGAAGFVGAHVLTHLLATTDAIITCPVTFAHKGDPARIAQVLGHGCTEHAACAPREDWAGRVRLIRADLRAPLTDVTLAQITAAGPVDAIFNVASRSHVDDSIADPGPFIADNVAIAITMCEAARALAPGIFLQMSTDEVYGPAAHGQAHKEWDPVRPSNPYSASKAAQEAVCYAYWRTYGIPLVLTNTMNLFAEMQDAEKFVPRVIAAIANNTVLGIHADLTGPVPVVGSRCWLHARNLADAWCWITEHVQVATYPAAPDPVRLHIVGEEMTNLDLALEVAAVMGTPLRHELVDVHATRPGHDLRYALDGTAIAAAGWKAPLSLSDSLHRSVAWTLRHPHWISATGRSTGNPRGDA